MAFQRVAHLSDVPEGRGLCVKIGAIEIGLFRVGEEIHAMENRCPHRDHSLSEGVLTGSVIVCPAHGWDFDVLTGFRPGDADGWPIPCFATRVDAGEVFVDPERAINLPRRRTRR